MLRLGADAATSAASDDRIAMMRELHDTALHRLSTVALQIMAAEADPAAAPQTLELIRQLTAEATGALRMQEKLLQSAAAPVPHLGTSAARPPTALAGEHELAWTRHGAHIEFTVPPEADHVELATRNTLVVAMELMAGHLTMHLPAGDRSALTIDVTEKGVRFEVLPRSSPGHAPLPFPSPRVIEPLCARVHLIGGIVTLTSEPVQDTWTLVLVLHRRV